ncbi:MAG: NAD-dependent epimerase/dehydratase family protein [Magnetospirillum sp.]|nr:NAD-dependent epimerase/dehydratase family protein [Magnetospirillum sp.]
MALDRNPLDRILAKDTPILVTGAGGFIGGHLVADLRRQGFSRIRAVDIKPVEHWFQAFDDTEILVLDLRDRHACRTAARGGGVVFNLACDMGGMGFIEAHKTDCMLSVLINTHLLMAAHESGCSRYLFASSACVYNGDKQCFPDSPALKEDDAYPALAEDGYGWEKLFGERLCRHYGEERGLVTRVARLHNVYGPLGAYDGGREKAPAALARKVATAKLTGGSSLEIWGDGLQTRSFTYIDDCLYGLQAIFAADYAAPINLGSAELVSIDQLADMLEEVAGLRLERSYDPSAPRGVRGRSSDNTLIRSVLNWEPSTPLRSGIARLYAWIEGELRSSGLRSS